MEFKKGDIVKCEEYFVKVHHMEDDKVWGYRSEDFQKVKDFVFTKENSEPFSDGGELTWCKIGEVELLKESNKEEVKKIGVKAGDFIKMISVPGYRGIFFKIGNEYRVVSVFSCAIKCDNCKSLYQDIHVESYGEDGKLHEFSTCGCEFVKVNKKGGVMSEDKKVDESVKIRDFVADVYEKSVDAIVVEKYIGDEIGSDILSRIMLNEKKDEVLKEALRRKEESEKAEKRG